jgi:hypothetical protein
MKLALSLGLLTVTTLFASLGCSSSDSPMDAAGGSSGMAQAAAGGSGGASGGSGGTGGANAAGSGGTGMAGTSATTVSYLNDIKPIFDGSCVFCHYTGGILIDIEHPFTPTTGLVNADNTWATAHPEAGFPTKNVTPGNPDQSFILMKIGDPNLPANGGAPMPWQIARLTDTEITALKQWISDGAQNDATYASTIHPIFGTPKMLATAGGKCCYCHFAGGQLPNLEDPFDAMTGAVSHKGMNSGTLNDIEPGNPDASFLITKVTATALPGSQGKPMPFRPDPLPAEDVAKVRQWILEGALNN